MMGRPEAPDQKGLIPRSLEQIFQISQSLQSQGWKYKMQVLNLVLYLDICDHAVYLLIYNQLLL